MKLRADNIQKIYGSRKVVKGISLEVEQGEIIGLLGPNGAGKTTSFYMIVGMIKPNDGHIFLDDEEITTDAMYKRSQKGIGYLAQEASVFRKLSVEDNIMSVLEFTDRTKAERKQRLEELIDEFSLGHVRKNRGDLLSGGERRRTEIARCLASDPKFILLDEPFAGVDPIAVEDIQGIVAQLKNKNIGILITDHDVQATLAITDRTYLMYNGGILKEGTPEELAEDETVRRVYLGKDFELKKKKFDNQAVTQNHFIIENAKEEDIFSSFSKVYDDYNLKEGFKLYRKKGNVNSFLVVPADNINFVDFCNLSIDIKNLNVKGNIKVSDHSYKKIANYNDWCNFEIDSDKVILTNRNNENWDIYKKGEFSKNKLMDKAFAEDKISLDNYHFIIDIYNPQKSI
ncbi:putative lipopolysaccharide transport protein B: ATP-binding component of ABC superfamily (modular protein) [Tenacibaculum litoreum]